MDTQTRKGVRIKVTKHKNVQQTLCKTGGMDINQSGFQRNWATSPWWLLNQVLAPLILSSWEEGRCGKCIGNIDIEHIGNIVNIRNIGYIKKNIDIKDIGNILHIGKIENIRNIDVGMSIFLLFALSLISPPDFSTACCCTINIHSRCGCNFFGCNCDTIEINGRDGYCQC